MGLKLKKIHKILLFKQKAFIAPFIAHIATLRTASLNEFEKKCLKLMANSLFGKMIEDIRKYFEVRICQTKQQFQKLASSPFFISAIIYSENLVICFMRKQKVYLRSCHAIGLSILDYSKLHMYDLYYNYIIPSTKLSPVNKTLSIIMSDTDSFLLAFKNKSLKAFFKNISHVMDYSNYPKEHPLYSDEVAGALGFLKDEMKGSAVIEGAVALKSKCYSIDSRTVINKCKGIPKIATSKLQFKHYREVLEKRKTFKAQFKKITSKKHIVSTTNFTRKSLSFYDDKRFYLCNIHSLPYGHYRIKKKMTHCDICTKSSKSL